VGEKRMQLIIPCFTCFIYNKEAKNWGRDDASMMSIINPWDIFGIEETHLSLILGAVKPRNRITKFQSESLDHIIYFNSSEWRTLDEED